jgi:catechol 2,3-dioxygenase-like lactoylglutathione lyase family enzyme
MSLSAGLPAKLPAPRLDHVVVDARDRMDEAVRVYRSLGFHMTERSRHTLGSINHLVVFDTDYLELLGFDPGGERIRPDLQAWPVGLNGLVFSLEQPEQMRSYLEGRGVAVDPVQDFSRPVNLGEGVVSDAKFRVVRLRAGTASFGRVYFCHHLTPELIWRREWQRHPNGAQAVERILVAVNDPAAAANLLARMFGPEAMRQSAEGAWTLAAGGVTVNFVKPRELGRRLGEGAPDPAGRADYMAALTIRTASLATAALALEAGRVAGARVEARRIVVPASAAMNVALEFVE